VEDAFGTGIAGDHAGVVVVGMMGQRFDRNEIA
jgi:hypothetical protein